MAQLKKKDKNPMRGKTEDGGSMVNRNLNGRKTQKAEKCGKLFKKIRIL